MFSKGNFRSSLEYITNKCNGKSKGITLMALVLTITIIFVLLGVTISLVIHTDLFSSAKTAKDKTEAAYVNESNFGDTFDVNGTHQNSIEEFVQSKCDHEWTEWVVTKEPTCTEEGSKRRECPRCEKVEVESIPAKGHDWDPETGKCKECGIECTHDWEEWQTITESTCTVVGIKKRTCTICKKIEMGTIPMIGHDYFKGKCTRCGALCPHDWEEWVIVIEPTCTEEGKKSRTCKLCTQIEEAAVPAKGHNWDPETGKCKDCDAECKHNWSEWVISKQPTCTAEGSKYRTCSICNKVETESIPAKGHRWNPETGRCKDCNTECTHNWSSWTTTTAATCTTSGSQRRTCNVCGKVENQSIPATGHSWNASTGKCTKCGIACTHSYGGFTTTTAATCTVAGSKYRTCSICSHKDVQSIAAQGHSYGGWVTTTSATCTATGVQTKTCSRCGAKQTQSISALGHNYGSWYTYKAETCTAVGIDRRKCSRCGNIDSRNVSTFSHSWGSYTTITSATCTEKGRKRRTCSRCGDYQYADIAALGHSWSSSTGTCTRCGVTCSHSYGSYTTTKAATCTASGSKYRTCSTCKYKETTTIPARGHSYGSYTTVREATCTTTGIREGTCIRCGIKQTQTIPALRHSWNSSTGRCTRCGASCSHTGSWTTTEKATCTSSGSKERTCTTCGYHETATISKTGHDYGSWKTTKAATCTSAGTKKRSCSDCGKTQTETISASGHSWKYIGAAPGGSTGMVKLYECSKCGASKKESVPVGGK